MLLTCCGRDVKTCTQPTTGPMAELEVPVQAYTLGGTMGYGVVDQDGVPVPESECPGLGPGINPVLIDRGNCTHGAGSV